MRGVFEDLVGREFGNLRVVFRGITTPSGVLWGCDCKCGRGYRNLTISRLRRTDNPGCKACETERRAAAKVTHGASANGEKTKLYQVWKGMLARCRDPGNTSYKYYGGKGIRVCFEWQSFEPFRDWALANGYVPGLSIDRRESWLDYAPENCEWVTRSENSRRLARRGGEP